MILNERLIPPAQCEHERGTMTERRDSYDYEGLLACARGELFGPGNAQLPLPPMLMFDRITSISETGGERGKGRIVAELISPARPLVFRMPF